MMSNIALRFVPMMLLKFAQLTYARCCPWRATTTARWKNARRSRAPPLLFPEKRNRRALCLLPRPERRSSATGSHFRPLKSPSVVASMDEPGQAPPGCPREPPQQRPIAMKPAALSTRRKEMDSLYTSAPTVCVTGAWSRGRSWRTSQWCFLPLPLLRMSHASRSSSSSSSSSKNGGGRHRYRCATPNRRGTRVASRFLAR